MLSSFGALVLASTFTSVFAVTVGGFDDGGSTLVSAMMVGRGSHYLVSNLKLRCLQMFLGNENSLYILDKAEMNAAQVNGHPAWGSLW